MEGREHEKIRYELLTDCCSRSGAAVAVTGWLGNGQGRAASFFTAVNAVAGLEGNTTFFASAS